MTPFKDYPDEPEPWQSEDEFYGGPFPRWVTPLILLAGSVVVLLSAAAGAFAHTASTGQIYEQYCCDGNNHTGDCQPIPTESVRVIQGGYQVTLRPGDHRLVTRVHVWQKAQAEVRYSSDGLFHACLYPDEDKLRCLYVPPFGA